jgi:hypothetical protein
MESTLASSQTAFQINGGRVMREGVSVGVIVSLLINNYTSTQRKHSLIRNSEFLLITLDFPPIHSEVNEPRPRKVGRRPTGKVTVQLRMAAATRDQLEHLALKDNQSLSECAETALLRYFKARRAKEQP